MVLLPIGLGYQKRFVLCAGRPQEVRKGKSEPFRFLFEVVWHDRPRKHSRQHSMVAKTSAGTRGDLRRHRMRADAKYGDDYVPPCPPEHCFFVSAWRVVFNRSLVRGAGLGIIIDRLKFSPLFGADLSRSQRRPSSSSTCSPACRRRIRAKTSRSTR